MNIQFKKGVLEMCVLVMLESGDRYGYDIANELSQSLSLIHIWNYCRRCGKLFDAQYLLRSSGVPRCDQCGGAVKPDVVLYEEALDQAVLQKAAGALRQADLLIVGGTSLTVYPAAGLLRYFQGSRLAVVNQTALPLDQEADLLIQGQIGQVFSQL